MPGRSIDKSPQNIILNVYSFLRDQRGITLVEALVSLAVLGIVAGIFLTGMGISSKAVMISQKRTSVESVAKSQMEYIMNQEYDFNNPPQYEELDESDIPSGCDIVIVAERLDPKGDGLNEDDGLQLITVIVEHDDEDAISLAAYKLSR